MPVVEKARVVRNEQVGPDLYEMECAAPRIASSCAPGQFVHVRTSPAYHPLLRRPLSLYDVRRSCGTIHLLYKSCGLGTGLLSAAAPGETIDILGPLGTGFTLIEAGRRALLVGGGVGIAPLVHLARALRERGREVRVLYGANTACELAASTRLDALGVDWLAATLDGSAGFTGLVTELLSEQTSQGAVDFIYTCGPEPMMVQVAEYAGARGIPGEASLEARMACGVGACLGCAVRLVGPGEQYARVCRDGPVFPVHAVEFRY
ncbi:MAG: dihydroorotate dehydrogenase electron transfer subunit [Firmicutes bacterium]|nr:dihydroorotate dehydrogenase electron transfer subunit [Bacillota bacterium]